MHCAAFYLVCTVLHFRGKLISGRSAQGGCGGGAAGDKSDDLELEPGLTKSQGMCSPAISMSWENDYFHFYKTFSIFEHDCHDRHDRHDFHDRHITSCSSLSGVHKAQLPVPRPRQLLHTSLRSSSSSSLSSLSPSSFSSLSKLDFVICVLALLPKLTWVGKS